MPAENAKGVIFDLDGVLVDTSAYHKQSWYDLARREGLEMSEAFFYDTFGMQNAQILPSMTDRKLDDEEIRRLSDWKEQRYRELISGELTLLEGVVALLEDLQSSGFKLAVGSSTPRVNLDFMLAHTQVQGYFAAYVTSEDVSRSKPAPDTFLKAAEKLDLPPGRCVVIEDAVPGVAAGKAAQMAVVAVTNTRPAPDLSQADLIVDSLVEVSAGDFQRLLE